MQERTSLMDVARISWPYAHLPAVQEVTGDVTMVADSLWYDPRCRKCPEGFVPLFGS